MMLKILLYLQCLSRRLRYKKQLKTIMLDKHMVTKIMELVRKESYTTTTGYNKLQKVGFDM